MAPCRHLRLTSLILVVFLAVALVLQPGYAGSAENGPGPRESAAGVHLWSGSERLKKWIDAITHYREKAINALSRDIQDLELGLRRSKIQFSIERRYTDNTFHKSLLTMPRQEAQALFNDVLNLVQSHYVETVSLTSFVAHGTESLYLSLAKGRFQQANVPSQFRGRVDKLRDILNHEFWNKPISTRDEAAARR